MAKIPHKRKIHVFADWEGMDNPKQVGYLYSERLRGKEIFSFEYHKEWLRREDTQSLDPDLQHFTGLQFAPDQRANFGMFLDSSPDRWGRVLMRRREAALARLEQREELSLYETDYLLGVYDAHRMGSLRFRLEEDGLFLNNNKELASPPWAQLRELEQVSLKLEEDEVIDDPDYLKWLSMLIAPGSSLGGARPKASITDSEGGLWIAKFPSKSDTSDMGAWEVVTYEMALAAGIDMAESRAQKFSTQQHTFLTKRFDRSIRGERRHFASAMTMLGYTDGDSYTDGVSYLDLVAFLQRNGAEVAMDLEELWRRIVFSICVSNTDDHLRNHGFILTSTGWRLSPAYDINPVETGGGLKLNISENDNSLSLELALDVATYFRLNREKAVEIIDKVQKAVQPWRTIAARYNISRGEQALKANAFRHAMSTY